MERMRRLRASLAPQDSAARFASLGVDVFFGEARFVSDEALQVGNSTLRFKRAAICTGARAAVPAIPGLQEAGFLTNESIFDLAELPRRMLVLGGGPIGCELAQAFARFGSEVTLVERGPRLLPKEDAGASAIIEQALKRDGVRVLTSCAATQFERRSHGYHVHFAQASGRYQPPENEHQSNDESSRGADTPRSPYDAILVATGRQPNIESLDLQKARVAFDPQTGIVVDDRLRTTNQRIYAAGDVCSRFKFTHAADAMARIVIQNSLFLGRKKASALTIPWCTYTSPEVAHVGVTEEQARTDGVAIDTFSLPLTSIDRNILDGDTQGFVKVHVKKGSDTILGGTIVDEHAGDTIGSLSHAMTHGLGLTSFSSTIFPYPTRAEAFRKLGDAYNRTRLTPTAQRVLRTWLRWTK
jgi:pyruvate/2-oxoglutarate dehydrogenase complex dihydrolipoamide dehydrogenase (E3) component